MFGSITVNNSQIIFNFSGSTFPATGTFVLNLTNFFPATITNVSFRSGSLSSGSFALTSFTSNSIVFTGSTNSATFSAVGGITIIFDVATVTPLDSAFQVKYAANLNLGESYIDISNDGANGAPLLGPGFGAAAGNICVNVYAFSPDEQLISCCSCLVTPNGLVHLGVNADLTSKTLTGVIPTSVVVKLVSTLAGPGGVGTSCANAAASATATAPGIAPVAGGTATGLLAWGTTLHPQGATFVTTETAFTPATLSAGELASITGRCSSILGNGSGFGICNSCKAGGLGGAKQ
jgi:hypothetical protein